MQPRFKALRSGFGLQCDWLAFKYYLSVSSAARSEGADIMSFRHLSHRTTAIARLLFFMPSWIRSDETQLEWVVLALTPNSHGNVTSTNPTTHSIIVPNYYTTDAYRIAIRTGVPKVLAWTRSASVGQSIVERELTEHKGDADEAIDAWLAGVWIWALFCSRDRCDWEGGRLRLQGQGGGLRAVMGVLFRCCLEHIMRLRCMFWRGRMD